MTQNDIHIYQSNEQDRLAAQLKKLQMLGAQECSARLLHCCRCQAICWFFQETQDVWGCLGCTYFRPLVESLDEHPDLREYRDLRIRKSGKMAYAIYDSQACCTLPQIQLESLDQARIEIDRLAEQRNIYTGNEAIVRCDRATFRYLHTVSKHNEKEGRA
ncbi:MAG: hypothetical protein H0U76_22260 [Ktedonobacteraceae bacterium]|nr:hypothetical protein [Ktedonobacteraceae bacterium]